jgi:DNA-binding HxlR family transcriptional regulator
MSKPKVNASRSTETGRFAYDLDRVIHEKARLSIITSLATHAKGLSFNDLKELCSLTDGNLSRHLQILQETGFIVVHKGFQGNRPLTVCQLTREGRRRFLEYIAVLEDVVDDAIAAQEADSAKEVLSKGLSPA